MTRSDLAVPQQAIPHAPALARVLREADDIARATGQRLTTAHALLALFTVRNHAERLLRDRGIDEDRLIDLLPESPKEPKHTLQDALARAAQIAAGCGASEVDCLHVLVAITRTHDAIAHGLLEATGEKLGHLRTRALTILTGAVPRWLAGRRNATLGGYGHDDTGAPRARSEREHLSTISVRPTRDERADRRSRSDILRRSNRDDRPSHDRPSYDRRSALEWSPPILSPTRRNRQRELSADLLKRASRSSGGKESIERSFDRSRVGAREDRERLDATSELDATRRESASEIDDAHRGSDAGAERHSQHASSVIASPPREDPAAQWLLSPSEYPWLTSLGRNISAEAARSEVDHLVGRDREVEELIDILGKRRANNPCLIGEPGVGKTAVVEGLALRLAQAGPNEALGEKILIGLDVGALLVGTHLRGSFSEKLQGLKEEVKQSGGRVIVFFDELHTLVGAGSSGDGPQDAANELKAALARGDFPCIGATTHDEYVKHIEPDAALKRRFYPVLVKEPSPSEALEMIRHIAPEYAAHHGVEYDEGALQAAVALSSRYITDRHLPDKAIALLDLAGSRAARAGKRSVTKELVAELVSERTELPIERLLSSDRERLLKLEEHLQKEIVGHRPQLHRIAEVIRRNAAGFTSKRPQGVFLFMGPTGVGKTETAKALAKVLHGNEDRMLRFDLSEFSEPHAVARLVGAPPGYVGHDAGGQLTEAVRRRPGRVILFDEIEKAHRDVLQILLQILDEGRLTDGRGQTVSFAEAIIVLTSNLGAELVRSRQPIGFAGAHTTRETSPQDRASLEGAILERARENLPPELWSRIEEKLVFAPLTREEVREIARLLAADSSHRLTRERGIAYAIDDSAVDYLLDQGGFDVSLGARPMRQILSRIVEAPIAARILEGRLHADEHVLVSLRENGGLAFLVGEERTSLSQRPPR